MPNGKFGGVEVGTGGIRNQGPLNLIGPGQGLGMQANGAGDKAGTALLAGGTKIVNTTAVTAASLIFLCHKGNGGAVGFLSETKAARVAGTSFTILSSNGADAGNVDWFIVEPT